MAEIAAPAPPPAAAAASISRRSPALATLVRRGRAAAASSRIRRAVRAPEPGMPPAPGGRGRPPGPSRFHSPADGKLLLVEWHITEA